MPSPADLHAEAMQAAFSLAKGTRLRELRGQRGTRAFDLQGLHPYSVEWGRILALEEVDPNLRSVRERDGVLTTPGSMRRDAEQEACLKYEEEVALGLGLRWGWITPEQAEAMRGMQGTRGDKPRG